MSARYGWLDFEAEPDMTGDGSGDPEKFFITVATISADGSSGAEVAVIVHRTCGGKYPLDGTIANEKRVNAQRIVDALNAFDTDDTPPDRDDETMTLRAEAVRRFALGMDLPPEI